MDAHELALLRELADRERAQSELPPNLPRPESAGVPDHRQPGVDSGVVSH
jgi:hypothetical protein